MVAGARALGVRSALSIYLSIAGATSIAGLKKWAARQQQQQHGSDEAAAPPQYVAVASDACNIEFDFLGRVQAGGASIVSIGDLSGNIGGGPAEESAAAR